MAKATVKKATPQKRTTLRKPPRKPAVTKTYTEDDVDIDLIADINGSGITGLAISAEDLPKLDAMKHLGFVEVFKSGASDAARISGVGAEWCTANIVEETSGDQPSGSIPLTAAPPLPAGTGFLIRTDISIPEGSRGASRREAKYPFGELPVGGSFHVKLEKKDGVPARYSSAVTAANRKFPDRGFRFRSVDESDPDGWGIRIFRVK